MCSLTIQWAKLNANSNFVPSIASSYEMLSMREDGEQDIYTFRYSVEVYYPGPPQTGEQDKPPFGDEDNCERR